MIEWPRAGQGGGGGEDEMPKRGVKKELRERHKAAVRQVQSPLPDPPWLTGHMRGAGGEQYRCDRQQAKEIAKQRKLPGRIAGQRKFDDRPNGVEYQHRQHLKSPALEQIGCCRQRSNDRVSLCWSGTTQSTAVIKIHF